jgi:gluconate 2-dehydrogenase gamma chain
VSASPLTDEQNAVLEAALARLIPADELGPGAIEAGVAQYIRAALGDWHRIHVDTYAQGLAALGRRALTDHGCAFAECGDAERDELLAGVEHDETTGPFFELLRAHAIEGMFGDPRWGANAGRAGWELLGYGGPRPEHTAQDQQLGATAGHRPAK